MSEGTTKVQLDKRACKLPTKAASEVTDEGNREERASTGVKAQQKPTCKKGINNDVLSSSSKDNLLSQGRKPKGCVVIFFLTCKAKRYKCLGTIAWGTRT